MRKDFPLIIVLSLTLTRLKSARARKDLRAFGENGQYFKSKVSIAILYEL